MLQNISTVHINITCFTAADGDPALMAGVGAGVGVLLVLVTVILVCFIKRYFNESVPEHCTDPSAQTV